MNLVIPGERILTAAALSLLAAAFLLCFLPNTLNTLNHNDFMYAAAPVVWEGGGRLYADVPFVQAPLSIMVPLVLKNLVGVDNLYLSGRLLSIVLVLAGTGLLIAAIRQSVHGPAAATFAVLAITNASILSTAQEIGSYALPLFLMCASFYVGTRQMAFEKKAFLICLFIGLAASAKINQILLLPGLLLFAYGNKPIRMRAVALAGAGLAIGLAPILAYLVTIPEDFIFQTLIFHKLTNIVRGMELTDSVMDIVLDTARFGFYLCAPIAVLSYLLVFHEPGMWRRVKILLPLVLCYGMAIMPMIVFIQYFAPLAAMVLFFCFYLLARQKPEHQRIALCVLIPFGAFQVAKAVPEFNVLNFSDYAITRVVSIQRQAKSGLHFKEDCAPKVFTTQPLFYLDDKAEYHPEAAAGPFWYRVRDGLPEEHHAGRDLAAEIAAFDPDILIYGFYGLNDGTETGRKSIDYLMYRFAARHGYGFREIGSVNGQTIMLAYRPSCLQAAEGTVQTGAS